MRRLKASHWNGYTAGNAVSVALKPKLKCCLCNKNKNTEANFSKKELAGLREVIARNGQEAGNGYEVTCIPCKSGGVSFEMTCVDCQKTMGLSSFARTQRKDRDNAKCMQCSAKRVAMKSQTQIEQSYESQGVGPGGQPDDELSEYGSSMDDTTSMTGSMSSMTLGSGGSNSKYSLDTTTGSVNTSGGHSGGVRIVYEDDPWLAQPVHSTPSSRHGSSILSAGGSAFTSEIAKASSSGFPSSARVSTSIRPAGWGQLRPPPSEDGSRMSSTTSNTETGSRARFAKPEKAIYDDADNASDSGSDDGWGNEDVHAAADDDSDDDESEDGPNFFG